MDHGTGDFKVYFLEVDEILKQGKRNHHMANWIIHFQPHASDWPEVRRRQSLRDYILPNSEIKKGDLAFLLAGSYGFCGWGYVKQVRQYPQNAGERNTYVEIMFDQLQENIFAEGEINKYPILVEARTRITGNLVRLEATEFNEVNRILRLNGLESPEDLPEFEVRIGKFGVKDNTSLSHELQCAAQKYDLVSVLFMDLDNFKLVNDDNTYSVGDQVIREALSEVAAIVDTSGELFHRSGDEMIVLLPHINDSAAMNIAEAIRHAIERKDFTVVGQGLVTATIGVATYPDNCETWKLLEETAEKRMKRIKKIKKNSIANQ